MGPVVCRLSTIETTVEPEMRFASDQPTVEKNGFIDTRTGYFHSNFRSVSPLARAVST